MVVTLLIALVSLWALYTLLALSFSLSFRVGGFFDLSIGASFLVGGYATWLLADTLPIFLSAIVAIGIAGVVSSLIGLFVVSPLAVKLPPLNLFILTLGILFLTQSLMGLCFGDGAKVLRSGANPTFQIFGSFVSVAQTALIISAVVALLTVAALLKHTPYGRFAQALADDRELADLLGVPIRRTYFLCYGMAGILAGWGGSLFIADRALDPGQAMTVLLAAMVATILGGESILGASIGALVLSTLETGLSFLMPGHWKTLVVFSVLLAALSWQKHGALTFIRRKL